MALLPTFITTVQELSLMQTRWKSILDPLLMNPVSNPRLIQNVELASGANVINHGLGRQMQGWLLADLTAAVTVYRSAPMNNQTLTLTASGAANCSLLVF